MKSSRKALSVYRGHLLVNACILYGTLYIFYVLYAGLALETSLGNTCLGRVINGEVATEAGRGDGNGNNNEWVSW